MRVLGLLFYIAAGIMASVGAFAFAVLVFGVRQDALAAAPAILVAWPWSTFLIDSDNPQMMIVNIILLAVMLAVNPLLLYLIGRRLRR